jgi:formylglycine-generating enzyme required for sulfatase activity
MRSEAIARCLLVTLFAGLAGLACSGTPPPAPVALDAGIVPAQSCAGDGPGVAQCGPDGDSCCASFPVYGGTFYRAYDQAPGPGSQVQLGPDGGPADEKDPATVSTFRLDKYEVTVGRFRRFVHAWNAGWRPAPGAGKHFHLNQRQGLQATGGGFEPGWQSSDDAQIAPTTAHLDAPPLQPGTWTAAPGAHEALPIVMVNWWEAYAFCIWDGGFLPSSAEWEYAAAGGSEQRVYPWGPADPATGNYAICNCVGATPFNPPIARVGTATQGVGRWGQLDLAGNVQEWNLDWGASCTGDCLNTGDTSAGACTDCAPFDDSRGRVTRGGAVSQNSPDMRPVVELLTGPDLRNWEFGFCCAHSPGL